MPEPASLLLPPASASQLEAAALTALGVASLPPLTAANLTGWRSAVKALLAVSALVAPIIRTAPDVRSAGSPRRRGLVGRLR